MHNTSQSRQITVSEMSPHVHIFNYGENKVKKISDWLINWIEKSLKNQTVKPYDMLPSKGDLAFHIGVSKGTMQNVFRFVEDCGYVESKQKIGTYIKNPNSNASVQKHTSKREVATTIIKRFILENNLQAGDCLTSTRTLSLITGISSTTIRIAIGSLISKGILKKENNTFIVNNIDFAVTEIPPQTLVEKTAENLKTYITNNFQEGEKLPANFELAKKFNVSVKTIHDSIKQLSKEGLLYTRRGQYGTVVSNNNKNEFYHYERIELKIKHYISENCKIGEKLPSIIEFSKMYKISGKTIKKALDNLAEEGYIMLTRGRYGGTFVTDIPQGTNEAYKWLALSPEYIPNMEN